MPRRTPIPKRFSMACIALVACLVAALLAAPLAAASRGAVALLGEERRALLQHEHSEPGPAVEPTHGCPCCQVPGAPCGGCTEDGSCTDCPPGCASCHASGAARGVPSGASSFLLPAAPGVVLIVTRPRALVPPHPDRSAPYRPPRVRAAVV